MKNKIISSIQINCMLPNQECCSKLSSSTCNYLLMKTQQHLYQALLSIFNLLWQRCQCVSQAPVCQLMHTYSFWRRASDGGGPNLSGRTRDLYKQNNQFYQAWLTKLTKGAPENIYNYLDCQAKAMVIDTICMRYDAITEYIKKEEGGKIAGLD